MDARLREEILVDCKRSVQGKLPLFMENIGKDAGSTGTIRYADGVEAMPPPTIRAGGDEEMQDAALGAEEQGAAAQNPVKEAQQREEEKVSREKQEAEEAKRWFAEVDKKYFTQDDGEERYYGHKGIWQRRELEGHNTLSTYMELRQDAQVVDQFLKSIPKHLEPNSPELAQWLDDRGVNDIILRNGTRTKWRPDMVFDDDTDEEEEEEDGEWHWTPPVDKDIAWFNATLRGLFDQAWELATPEEAAVYFRQHNKTMFDLASLHMVLADSDILDVREQLEDQAGDDERLCGIVAAGFDLLLAKWREIHDEHVYREDIVAALDRAEASFRGRYGSKDAQYFSVPRPRDYYADPEDD